MTFEEATAKLGGLLEWSENGFPPLTYDERVALRTVLAAVEGGWWEGADEDDGYMSDTGIPWSGEPYRFWRGPYRPATPDQAGEAS